MPRVPDVPCADCGKLMWRGTGSLPPGQARCQPCRRADWQHGTQKGYRRAGCRCDECRRWARESMAEYIASIKERDGVTPRVKYRKTPDVHCVDCGDRLRFGGGGRGDAPPRCLLCSRRRPHIPQSLRQSVYDRDGLVCHICNEPTDPAAEPRTSWYPSLDHVVPYSKGGPDTFENLRTAHLRCNVQRGASDLLEEAS